LRVILSIIFNLSRIGSTETGIGRRFAIFQNRLRAQVAGFAIQTLAGESFFLQSKYSVKLEEKWGGIHEMPESPLFFFVEPV